MATKRKLAHRLRKAFNQQPKQLWGITGKSSTSIAGSAATGDDLPTNQIYVRVNGDDNNVKIVWAADFGRRPDVKVWLVFNDEGEWEVDRLHAKDTTSVYGDQAAVVSVPNLRNDLNASHLVGSPNLLIGRVRNALDNVGTLVVTADRFTYSDSAGNEKIFDADNTATLTLVAPAQVAGADQKCYVRVSLNPDSVTPVLVATYGSSLDATLDLALTDSNAIATPAGNIPLWDIPLTTGDSTIPDATSWIDRRPWLETTWGTPGSLGAIVPNSATVTTLITTLLKLKTSTVLTIASGVVTAAQSFHRIDTEASAASDDLDTISGGAAGYRLVIRASNTARTVVVKHNTGNIQTFGAADVTLDETYKFIELIYDSDLSKWVQIGGAGGASSLTTKGDLYGHSTVDARIPVGTNGQVLTANSAVALGVDWETPATGGAGSLQSLFVQTASVTVANTTTETTLVGAGTGSTTLIANLLAQGKGLHITASGPYSDAAISPGTMHVKITLGGTQILLSAEVAIIAAVTNAEWSLWADIDCRTAGVSGTVFAQGQLVINSTDSVAQVVQLVSTAAVTVNTTGTLATDVLWKWSSASASNTTTCTNLKIQLVDTVASGSVTVTEADGSPTASNITTLKFQNGTVTISGNTATINNTATAAAASPSANEGRLTLTTAVPVTTGNVTAATTLYWTPYFGNQISLYDGAVDQIFASPEVSVSLAGLNIHTLYDVFGVYSTGALTLELLAWTAPSTGTITGVTNASPPVVTSNAHGLSVNNLVTITGVVGATGVNTTARISAVTANTFTLQTLAAVNLGAPGVYVSGGTWVLAYATSTRATAVDTRHAGYLCKNSDATRRYLGTIRITNVSGQTEDSYTYAFVWNNNNRVEKAMINFGPSGANYTVTVAAGTQEHNNNYACRIYGVAGLVENSISVTAAQRRTNTGASSFSLNAAMNGGAVSASWIAPASVDTSLVSQGYFTVAAGLNRMNALEQSFGATTTAYDQNYSIAANWWC